MFSTRIDPKERLMLAAGFGAAGAGMGSALGTVGANIYQQHLLDELRKRLGLMEGEFDRAIKFIHHKAYEIYGSPMAIKNLTDKDLRGNLAAWKVFPHYLKIKAAEANNTTAAAGIGSLLGGTVAGISSYVKMSMAKHSGM